MSEHEPSMRLSCRPPWERTNSSNNRIANYAWTMYPGKWPWCSDNPPVPMPIPWILPVIPDVPTPQPEPVPPISDGRILYNDLEFDSSTFGDLCWSAYNHLVTNDLEKLKIVESFVDKETVGRALPDLQNKSEVFFFISSLFNELLPKFLNSFEGQRLIKDLSDEIEIGIRESPSSRYLGVFIAGMALGAAVGVTGMMVGLAASKKIK